MKTLFSLLIFLSTLHGYDVIVVGAGISGLACAHELQQGGKEVLVLEANDRLGGRLYSVHPWGASLELGASWIHGVKNNPVMELAKKLELHTHKMAYNHLCPTCQLDSLALYNANGKKVDLEPLKALNEAFFKYIEKLEAPLSLEQAFDKFVEEKKVPEPLIEPLHYIALVLTSFDQAGDMERMSIQDYDNFAEEGPSGDDVLIVEGYNRITSSLAENLAIELN